MTTLKNSGGGTGGSGGMVVDGVYFRENGQPGGKIKTISFYLNGALNFTSEYLYDEHGRNIGDEITFPEKPKETRIDHEYLSYKKYKLVSGDSYYIYEYY